MDKNYNVQEKINPNFIKCDTCGKRKATWINYGFFVCIYCKGSSTRLVNRIKKTRKSLNYGLVHDQRELTSLR